MLNEVCFNNKVDCLFINDLTTIRYLYNFTGSNAFVLYSNNKVWFFSDTRYELQSKNEVKNVNIYIYESEVDFWAYFSNIIKNEKFKTLGFIDNKTYYSFYLKLCELNIKLKPISFSLSNLRLIKKDNEIVNIKKAINISEKSITDIMDFILESPSELALARKLDAQMIINGSSKNSFDTIVSFGKNSALPHHSPSNKIIKGNGILTIDFGAMYNGYSSDQSISLILGKIDDKLEHIYDLVNELRQNVIQMLKPGLSFAYLQRFADEFFKKNKCSEYSKHSLGHGLGIDVHEEPMSWNNLDLLTKENMVFTIEPGLYIPNLGGVRLEDLVRITKNSCEIMTNLSKDKKYIL